MKKSRDQKPSGRSRCNRATNTVFGSSLGAIALAHVPGYEGLGPAKYAEDGDDVVIPDDLEDSPMKLGGDSSNASPVSRPKPKRAETRPIDVLGESDSSDEDMMSPQPHRRRTKRQRPSVEGQGDVSDGSVVELSQASQGQLPGSDGENDRIVEMQVDHRPPLHFQEHDTSRINVRKQAMHHL